MITTINTPSIALTLGADPVIPGQTAGKASQVPVPGWFRSTTDQPSVASTAENAALPMSYRRLHGKAARLGTQRIGSRRYLAICSMAAEI